MVGPGCGVLDIECLGPALLHTKGKIAGKAEKHGFGTGKSGGIRRRRGTEDEAELHQPTRKKTKWFGFLMPTVRTKSGIRPAGSKELTIPRLSFL